MQLNQITGLISAHDRKVASLRGLSDEELAEAGRPYATATGLIRVGLVEKCPGGVVTDGRFDEAFQPTSITCRLVLKDLDDETESNHHLGVVRLPRIDDRRIINSGLLQSTNGPELPDLEALRLRSLIDEAGRVARITAPVQLLHDV
jgi:hypothetical protein